jgi:hypothetical protein
MPGWGGRVMSAGRGISGACVMGFAPGRVQTAEGELAVEIA